MDKKELFLFDLDGTLIDSAELLAASYVEALKSYGCQISTTEMQRLMHGKHAKYFLKELLVEASDAQIDGIRKEKNRIYLAQISKLRLNRPLLAIVETLSKLGTTALVTTASREVVDAVVNCFRWNKLFRFSISGDDVCKPKPDPECYLAALYQTNVKAENAVAFEDSPIGQQAALKAAIDFI